jgi:hypothetical protein
MILYKKNTPKFQAGGSLTERQKQDSALVSDDYVNVFRGKTGVGNNSPVDKMRSGYYGLHQFLQDKLGTEGAGFASGIAAGESRVKKGVMLTNDMVVSMADRLSSGAGDDIKQMYDSLSEYDRGRVDSIIERNKKNKVK